MAGINSQQVYLPTPDQSETTGAVAVAPVSTAPITSARTALGEGWESGGYIDENGVSLSVSRSFEGIKDWAQTIVRKALTDYDGTLALSFLQVDEFAAKRILGEDNVSKEDNQLMLKIGPGAIDEIRSWCFSMKDADRRIRIYIPRGQITDITSEVTFVPGQANVWPCQISTYDDGTGHSIYVIYDDGTTITDNTGS